MAVSNLCPELEYACHGFPTGTWRRNVVVPTSMRCNDVTSTSVQHQVPIELLYLGAVPAGTWLRKDVGLTLIRRGDVLLTSIRHRDPADKQRNVQHPFNIFCYVVLGKLVLVGAFFKHTYWSRLHPYDATPSVFETKFCENLFDLTNIVCCYETRNVYGMYRNSHDVIWRCTIQEIGDCKRVLCFSCDISQINVYFCGIGRCVLIE